MARKTPSGRSSAASKSAPRSGARATSRTASRSARAASAQPAWRESVEQALSAGKGAVDFVQRQGAQALLAAQRRSSALSFKAREAAEQRLEAVAVKIVGSWDQVEQVASERVGKTLNRLGVPSQKDIDKLTRSVAKLSAQIDQLSAAAPAAKAAPAKTRAPRRAAATA